MKGTTAILINGPEGCGKTELTKYLKNHFTIAEYQCKDKLHELTMALFRVDPDTYWEIYTNRIAKATPNPVFEISYSEYTKLTDFLGCEKRPANADGKIFMTIREAMIYVSEVVCKPAFGKEYFGEVRAERAVGSIGYAQLVVDDSTGFEDELYPLIKVFKPENILLIRIHGRSEFSTSDSRGYIRDGVIENSIDVYNDGDEFEFYHSVASYISSFIDEKIPFDQRK